MKKIIIGVLLVVALIALILIGGTEDSNGMKSKFMTFIFGNNGEATIYSEEGTDLIAVEDVKSVEIFPLEKITINDTDISLGMDKAEVTKLLGKGDASGDSVRYFESELGIYYDSNNKVEFIEFYGGIDGNIKPVIYGVSAFETKARDLVEIIEKHNSGNNYFDADIVDFDSDYDSEFYNISVGLYRDITPDAVASMKEEMIAEGVFDENDEDYLNDVERSKYWGTIGMGVEGYYK